MRVYEYIKLVMEGIGILLTIETNALMILNQRNLE